MIWTSKLYVLFLMYYYIIPRKNKKFSPLKIGLRSNRLIYEQCLRTLCISISSCKIKEFEKLNPIPSISKDSEVYLQIRQRAFQLQCGGMFSHDNISPATRVYFETFAINPISFVAQNSGGTLPTYYNFVISENPP